MTPPEFTIVGNELRVGAIGLDFKVGATRTITVRVVNSGSAAFDKSLVITILNVADTPVVKQRGIAYAARRPPMVISPSLLILHH